jgi:hypothetical protein
MSHIPTKSSLSPSRRHLLETLQQLNFGRIENLRIACGEPILIPPPTIVQDIRIGATSGPRPELNSPDFLLRTEFVELFEHLDRLQNGTIQRLEVRHGLPQKLEIAQPGRSPA